MGTNCTDMQCDWWVPTVQLCSVIGGYQLYGCAVGLVGTNCTAVQCDRWLPTVQLCSVIGTNSSAVQCDGISVTGAVRGPWKHTRRLWRWAPSAMGTWLGNLGKGLYVRGLCVEEHSGMGVSPYRCPSLGIWEGGTCNRKLRMS